MGSALLEKLEHIFAEIRAYLTRQGLSETEPVGRNVKGQHTRRFDERTEHLVIEQCRAAFAEPIAILGEECGEVLTREGEPKYLFLLDPVDGSLNYSRGMEISAFSIAVLPGSAERSIKNVTHALVGTYSRAQCTWRREDEAPPETIPPCELRRSPS